MTRPSLAGNSLARLVSDLWALVMSLVAATVTARLLGPAGKGFYSSLVLLAGAFIQIFAAGLGEAAVILAGQARYALRDAVAATVTAIIPLSMAGGVAFVAIAHLVLRPETVDDSTAVAVGGGLVAVMVLYTTATWVLVAQERVVQAAVLAIILATVTTGALWVLVAGADLGTTGALLGGLAGASTVLAGSVLLLFRQRLLPRPRRVPGFVGDAARLGMQLQFASLLVTLTARLDLILVYDLSTPAAAGNYSVALTIGALVATVPTAIAYASFPRLASVDEAAARALTGNLYRMGVAASLLAGAVLAAVTPVVVTTVFGSDYRGAIAPTLLLIPAGVLWSAQWLLCRAAAARGRAGALSLSFMVSFVAMVLADLALIPALDIVGAGIGSLVGSMLGFAIAIRYYRSWNWSWSEFVPGPDDVKALASTVRQFFPARQPS